MNYINEDTKKWSSIISEELGVKNAEKLDWMSRYARNHAVYEGLQDASFNDGNLYATPLNTMGMGNPMNPALANIGAQGNANDFHSPLYQKGSGDIPMSTLSMALEVAACTIGFELVQVVPAPGPWAMLSYMDFVYGGGKMGRPNETSLDGKGEGADNKPIYVHINHVRLTADEKKKILAAAEAGTKEVKVGDFTGEFIAFSRINNDVIVKVVSCKDENQSIAEAMDAAYGKAMVICGVTPAGDAAAFTYRADLVETRADFRQGFQNFFDGSDDPMTRAQNETGVGNTIGARMFTKLVQMGSYEVTGTVTRQQLQDMPLYGIDVVGKVLEAMQNDLSQAINNRILDRIFKLGVTNARIQKDYQGADLNLYFGAAANATKNLSDFACASKYVGIDGRNEAADWGAIKNATQNTAAENVTTHQRRIMSRILAASNLIANVSRWGRANFVVCGVQIASALQDSASFVVAPMVNTLAQDGSNSLYFCGSVAGLNVYVDPYMDWNDTRVCVGRKGTSSANGNQTPGVIFMPYILCDSVQITAEATLAPKLLCNSRWALIDAGRHPEQSYYTFMVESDGDYII